LSALLIYLPSIFFLLFFFCWALAPPCGAVAVMVVAAAASPFSARAQKAIQTILNEMRAGLT